MDYEINIDSLDSKKNELEEMKNNISDIHNSLTSGYLNTISNSDISELISKIKTLSERLKNGYSNSSIWLNNYLKELKELESNLSNFSVDSIEEPKPFTGEFADIFSKVTIPKLKSDYKEPDNEKLEEKVTSGLGNTQASSFYALGDAAYDEWQEYTENSARGEWIRKVGEIVKNTNTYGMKKSLIIAQIINESGWMSTHASSLSNYNNVLGINTDMGRITPDMQSSSWSKRRTSGVNTVTQWNSSGTTVIPSNESMRHYSSIEECIEDYANVLSLYHPECVGSNNLEDYRSFLEGYTPNPNASTTDKYKGIIAKYNLERFDV